MGPPKILNVRQLQIFICPFFGLFLIGLHLTVRTPPVLVYVLQKQSHLAAPLALLHAGEQQPEPTTPHWHCTKQVCYSHHYSPANASSIVSAVVLRSGPCSIDSDWALYIRQRWPTWLATYVSVRCISKHVYCPASTAILIPTAHAYSHTHAHSSALTRERCIPNTQTVFSLRPTFAHPAQRHRIRCPREGTGCLA